jgi:hypothetical protein
MLPNRIQALKTQLDLIRRGSIPTSFNVLRHEDVTGLTGAIKVIGHEIRNQMDASGIKMRNTEGRWLEDAWSAVETKLQSDSEKYAYPLMLAHLMNDLCEKSNLKPRFPKLAEAAMNAQNKPKELK